MIVLSDYLENEFLWLHYHKHCKIYTFDILYNLHKPTKYICCRRRFFFHAPFNVFLSPLSTSHWLLLSYIESEFAVSVCAHLLSYSCYSCRAFQSTFCVYFNASINGNSIFHFRRHVWVCECVSVCYIRHIAPKFLLHSVVSRSIYITVMFFCFFLSLLSLMVTLALPSFWYIGQVSLDYCMWWWKM